MKNPNGAGCVSKASGKRRKPWKAIITTAREYDAEKGRVVQRRKIIGYYKTRTEAEDALSNYRQNPYDLDKNKITFSEIYKRWSDVYFEKISASRKNNYTSAYNKASPLHSMKFSSIRPAHIEKCMKDCEEGSAVKNNIKQLCGQLYKYAIKSELATVNYAAMCDGIPEDAPKIIRTVFSKEEEDVLWKMQGDLIADMILVGIYTGWRPKELCLLKCDAVNTDEWYIQGGIKTRAGKNRIVPIHSRIKPIIENYVDNGVLFKKDNSPLSYRKYYYRFSVFMEKLNMNHMPHDTRHTFITRAKEAGMNEHILKLIVGHSEKDITEKIYTHRRIEELKAEIEKIK